MMRAYLGDAAATRTPESQAYLDAMEVVAPGILDQAANIKMPNESWIDAATRAISTLSMADAQRRILNVQVERAKQGLPPLDSSQYGLGVSVGISPEIKQLMIWGGGALLLTMILPRLLKR